MEIFSQQTNAISSQLYFIRQTVKIKCNYLHIKRFKIPRQTSAYLEACNRIWHL